MQGDEQKKAMEPFRESLIEAVMKSSKYERYKNELVQKGTIDEQNVKMQVKLA